MESSPSMPSENSVLIEDLLPDNPESPNKVQMLNSEQRRKASRKMRNLHSHFYQHERDIRSPKKGNGVRHTRRCENLNYLLSLVEADQDESDQGEFTELVEPRLSAFAQLLRETEKMKIWNDFVNRTEEDQLAFIDKSCPVHDEPSNVPSKNNHDNHPHVEKQDEEGSEKSVPQQSGSDDESWEIVDDKRTVHPSYTAEEGFKKINRKIRLFLSRRHLPWGTLEQLEDEITCFFTEWPSSVYISQIHSSFDRMLLHALCQYLNLYSKSFDDKTGKRQTQVENKEKCFCLPKESLTHYLEQKHSAH